MRVRAGFTMAELMVVISIIALLAAIIVPNFVGAQAQARILLCANHLKRIREATQTWAADMAQAAPGERNLWNLQRLTGNNPRQDEDEGAGWPAVVIRYTGNSNECLQCPDGGELPPGTPVESQIVIRTSPTSGTAVPFVGLMDGGGFKVLKLSQTQWDAGIAESARYEPVLYVPDSNPNVYWWGYDDGAIGSGDYDFQDLAIKVTKHDDGTATIHVVGETAGKPEIWSADLTKCYAKWDDFNAYYEKRGQANGVSVDFPLKIGGGSHYGMNGAKIDMRSPGKIQALDYLRSVADSTDHWDNPEWDRDGDEQPDFLRHRGRLNVLSTDGSVRLMYRDDVDPEDIEVERKLWQP